MKIKSQGYYEINEDLILVHKIRAFLTFFYKAIKIYTDRELIYDKRIKVINTVKEDSKIRDISVVKKECNRVIEITLFWN